MNSPITHAVVVGVDGCPGSAGALRYAVAQARHRQAPLRLVHVVPTFFGMGSAIVLSDLYGAGQEIVDEATKTVHALDPELEVTKAVVPGDRSAGLVEEAEDAQLVVVGSETRHGVGRLLTGTVTASVAAHAPCDVVVVPSFWEEGSPHRQVVVGLKSPHDTRELLARAFAEASERVATLVVVTAWEFADPYFDRAVARGHAQDREEQGRQVVAKLTADWRAAYPQVAMETRVLHGAPARVLLDTSKDSDLLVISRRRFALPPYGNLGGVGHDLLRLSDVPVLVVPYAADQAEEPAILLEEDGALLK